MSCLLVVGGQEQGSSYASGMKEDARQVELLCSSWMHNWRRAAVMRPGCLIMPWLLVVGSQEQGSSCVSGMKEVAQQVEHLRSSRAHNCCPAP
jgi:hypothetical protein